MLGNNRDEGAVPLVRQKADARQSEQQAAGRDKQGGEPEGAASTPLKQPPGNSEAAVANHQTQTEQPNPYELRGLIAQEVMADAAVWMVVAAFLTFAVTSVGTLLIWRQVKLTLQAVKDTGEATKAMGEQTEIARKAFQYDNRAWVTQKLDLTELRWSNGAIFIRGKLQIENIGKSFAHLTWHVLTIDREADTTSVVSLDPDDGGYSVWGAEITLMPGQRESLDVAAHLDAAGQSAIPIIFSALSYETVGIRGLTSRPYNIGWRTPNMPAENLMILARDKEHYAADELKISQHAVRQLVR